MVNTESLLVSWSHVTVDANESPSDIGGFYAAGFRANLAQAGCASTDSETGMFRIAPISPQTHMQSDHSTIPRIYALHQLFGLDCGENASSATPDGSALPK
jgi:hypothetical protein